MADTASNLNALSQQIAKDAQTTSAAQAQLAQEQQLRADAAAIVADLTPVQQDLIVRRARNQALAQRLRDLQLAKAKGGRA